ncbi:MAG: 4'-phosphopantetheinyl transferase superfamily protein [Anaerolineae bacterium]|nr:4'-phosphopantetheinyl transferase superfamily protein [Anaerolineae bacterium]
MTTTVTTWLEPPAQMRLDNNQVHIWCFSLDQPLKRIAQLAELLSRSERERANRFVFDKDRRHFTTARASLRLILSRYVQTTAQQLRFRYSAHGKPELTGGNDGSLQFNLSHSHSMALVAVACDSRVGVDVEWVRPLDDMDAIAKRFFSRVEYEAYSALPTNQRAIGFFNCWTRKEAYIKAIGEGLSCPLASFDVSLSPGQPAKLLGINEDRQAAEAWFMEAMTPVSGYVGAVVIERQTVDISYWQGNESLFNLQGIYSADR